MGSINNDESDIPIIDISDANHSAPQQLLDAAARYGFVFIENDDTIIASSTIDHMFELSQTFFSSSQDVKEAVSINSNHAGKNHGWLSRGVEKLDPSTQKRPDVKEAFNIGSPIGDKLQQPLPTPLQDHQQTIIAFQRACRELCNRALQHFATALELDDKDWFTSRHDESKGPSGTVFRLLYYPHTDDAYEEGVDVRAGAHSDYGSVTLLFQQRGGQPGLEIKMPPDGRWVSVPVDPSSPTDGDESRRLPILLNIGDLLDDWTGGLLKSTVHRVVFPKGRQGGGDRYSMAYFCHPLDDALLEPVPSRLVERHTPEGECGRTGDVITAKDHLMQRLAATYKVG